MTLLVAAGRLPERRAFAAGALQPLAQSLAAELLPVVERTPEMPTQKAMLSRDGGRCPTDGASLEFDPWSPHRHRCPRCGTEYDGERHHLWWIMGQQLWLAERAAVGATLHLLTGDQAAGALARRILEMAADGYLKLPNRDNVLGPSRPFFSTYLESIWTLQLAVALDLLEMAGDTQTGALVRDRVLEPSATLIGSYDEGNSNRQVWNVAASLAAWSLLGRDALVQESVHGRSGVIAQLSGGLLSDGTWYEGENYHLFAHRGLWYAVTMCETLRITLPHEMRLRFTEGFATPLLTALPDLTFPARRDSQYAVSLRQWRVAESLELGLARAFDSRLAAGLSQLYDPRMPRGDTGRWRSTAEAERNVPASSLSRADLGWKSLLSARGELPPLEAQPVESVLLEGQGLAVLRPSRESRACVMLEYGQPGGGHGHPDRLGITIAVGEERWLDDPGTGSYVDPSLFWYRSTLAHNAPLVDGESQRPGSGRLCAFESFRRHAWVEAELDERITGGVHVRRTIVTAPDYVLDLVEWVSSDAHTIDLPFHVPYDAAPTLPWSSASIPGSKAPTDGFTFLRDVMTVPAAAGGRALPIRVHGGQHRARALMLPILDAGAQALWWRARTPPTPAGGEGSLLALRANGARGAFASIWSWAAPVLELKGDQRRLTVLLEGQLRPDVHERRPKGWAVTHARELGASRVELRGRRADREGPTAPPLAGGSQTEAPIALAPGRPFRRTLGRVSYRRSELSWEEAGSPTAEVEVERGASHLVVTVVVRKPAVSFRGGAEDPGFDNEAGDIHGDGVQLHLLPRGDHQPVAWLFAPAGSSHVVHVRRIASGARAEPEAHWRRTAEGYVLRIELPLAALGDAPAVSFALDVLVNENVPDRARRRGQLVLSGAEGQWIYLRGDRHPVSHYLTFTFAND
jgi:hypothetical protein